MGPYGRWAAGEPANSQSGVSFVFMSDESHVRRRSPRRATQGSPRRWRPAEGWRDLLVGRDPEAVLARIAEDDPLDLRRLCALRLREAAVLVDADRVHLGALSLIAFTAASDGPPDRRRTLVALVDRAVAEAVADAPLEGRGPGAERAAAVFRAFAAPLALEPHALGRACESFNACSPRERSAFFALVVERRDLDDAARDARSTPVELARLARRALEAALAAALEATPRGASPTEAGAENARPHSAPAGPTGEGQGALEVSDGGC